MAQIVVLFEEKEIARYQLRRSALTIGRDPNADIHLDNRALSRRHAQIEKRGAAVWISDLGSQNGTYVNGEPVESPRALQFGDAIEVGRYRLELLDVEEAAPETPVLTLDGPEGKHRFALVGDEIIIGRSPQCDIAIGHKSVSRRHVRIVLAGPEMLLEDLGSQNGTILNGKPTDGPTPFRLGDDIRLSDFSLKIEQMKNTSGIQDKRRNTMVIDKSEMANAAYMEGEKSQFISAASGQAVGRQKSEDSLTRNPTNRHEPIIPDREPSYISSPGLQQSAQTQKYQAVLKHRDFSERHIEIKAPFTVLGEEGQTIRNESSSSIALEGAIILTPTAQGVITSVAGDRRLLLVDDKPVFAACLLPGQSALYGVLNLKITS